ncbi:MAG: protein kinase domain-containing protein [Myxococcota bacterium]
MAATACLDPTVLLAYAEGAPPSPTDAEHLTGCSRCRAALVTAMARTLPSGSSGDGATPAPPRPLEATDRYVPVRSADGQPAELGTGGFARVALARDERLGREVALKRLRGARLRDGRRELSERRLEQEALVISRLEHPSIVPLYDLARDADGALFYVMRRVQGRTLDEVIREAGALEQRLRLLPHVLAACQAVAYAHSRGVLHRDLKPQNVMLGPFGETLVIDWGLAARGPDESTGSDEEPVPLAHTLAGKGRVGTPAYMSPEQLAGAHATLDARTDVFGLGALLFEVLTGKAPRESGALEADVRPVRALEPAVPIELASICDKALAADRARRYQTAAELAKDLDAWLHGQRVTAHEYRLWELVRLVTRRHRAAVAVALVSLGVLTAATALYVARVRDERNQARAFALVLAEQTAEQGRFEPRSRSRHRVGEHVSDWLSHSRELGDDARAAWLWGRLAGRALAWQSFDEARAVARRCLELVKPASHEPRMRAAQVWCQIVDLAAHGPPTAEHLARLDQLWAELPDDDSWERHVTAEYLASSASALRLLAGVPADPWLARAQEHAEAVTRLRPNNPESWSRLASTLVTRVYMELNRNRGEAALAHARRAVEVAREAHALGRTDQTLFVIADVLVDVLVVHHLHPELVTAAETARVGADARRQLEAVLEINPEDVVARRRYLHLLVETGALAELPAQLALLPADGADGQTGWAALLTGQPELALSLAPTIGEDSFDGRLVEALAHERRGALADAARAARQAAQLAFVSSWPLETMSRWAQNQPDAERLRALFDELDAAQRTNDQRRAQAAVTRFADALTAR